MSKLTVTLLAGGMGKRMRSSLPKVLHLVKGEAMIVRLLKQVLKMNPNKILIVVGKFKQQIQDEIEKSITDSRIVYVMQETPLGSGHAVRCTLEHLDENTDNIILNSDVPMLTYETINQIYQHYLTELSEFLITSINLDNPFGNGRIVVDQNDIFQEIVEEKDCTAKQRKITLVNCGIYIFHSDILKKYVPQIKNNNAQSEYYLTDLVKMHSNDKKLIDLFVLPKDKQIEIYNVNTKEQLEYVESLN